MHLLKSKIKKISRHETAKLMGGASFVFICRVIGAASVLITQIMLARWMGAEQLGIYVYVFAWCILLSTISGLGFPNAAFRFIGEGLAEKNDNKIISFARRGTEIVLISSLVVTVVGYLLVTEIDGFIAPIKQTTLLIAILAIPIYALILWVGNLAHSISMFRLATLPELVVRPLLLLIVVGLLWFSGCILSSDTIMLSHLSIMAVILIIQFYFLKTALNSRFPKFKKPKNETKLWVKTSIPLLLTALFIRNFLELNLIFVGGFLPADQIAVFSVTIRVAFLIAFGIHAIDAITMPRVAELHATGDFQSLQKLVYRATVIKFFGALLGVIGLAIFGKYVLALFGAEFVMGYNELLILACSQLIVAGFGSGSQLLNVSGFQNQCLYVFIFSTVVLLGLHSILIPRLGLQGVAIAVLVVIFVQSWWVNELVRKKMKIYPAIISFRKYLKK